LGCATTAHCRISVDFAGYHSSDRQIRPRLNDLCLQSLGLEKAPICGDIEIGKSDASARHRNLYLEQTTLGPQLSGAGNNRNNDDQQPKSREYHNECRQG
jgi:hypothetical protein